MTHGARAHTADFCTCASHVDRPWDRSEHWTRDEVNYLERWYGLQDDAAMAKRLGRSVLGIRLKAKRLHLLKRSQGFTARQVAQIFGVDDTTVSKVWIKRGLLAATRGCLQGRNRIHVVDGAEIERFIREHGEYVDVDKMPDSPYRDLAASLGRWYSLPALLRLTGRHPGILSGELACGRFPARKRGAHWRVHEEAVPAIAASASRRRADAVRYERTNEYRRNVRKGVEQPRAWPPIKAIAEGRIAECLCVGAGCWLCRGMKRVLVISETPRQYTVIAEPWAA